VKPYKGFEPKWVKEEAPKNSLRSIYRWGDPKFVKYPKESLYNLMKEFNLKDEDFKDYKGTIGFEEVKDLRKPNIDKIHIDNLKKIVGKDNISLEDYDRLQVSYGKTAYDIMRMREHKFDSLPDVVLYPSSTKEIEEIVNYATKEKIPLYVYGGGSSVTRGVEPTLGGISLHLMK